MIPPAEPVRFDPAAAEAAMREASLTASALAGVSDLLESAVATTADGWSGPTRSTFDLQSARHDVTAISLAESLQTMAVQIAALRYEADAESRRRLIVHDAAVEAERRAQALDAQSGPP
jgi:hypothetical protein